MKFGPVALAKAKGCVLGHAVKLADGRLPKGHVLTDDDLALLHAAGLTAVIVARLDSDDLLEDVAAGRMAAAIPCDHLRFSQAATGRVNIYANTAGVFVADSTVVNRFNRIDSGLTLACLADHVPVRSGDMVATIKVIPLAVPSVPVEEACALLRISTAFEVKPFVARRVALVATTLPSLKATVMDKTRRVLEDRLRLSGSVVEAEVRVDHTTDAVAAAIGQASSGCDMIIVFGASAVADADDVVPAGLRLAGGVVEYLGMPVDPGNLLVLGRLGDVPVIGAPGCARSPKENGFDWILNRILVGERPSAADISGMGVGGLLMEIPSRPLPRARAGAQEKPVTVGIAVLAAGKASRMGPSGRHKLLAEFDGVPLVRRSVETALGASESPVVVVTGHRAAEIKNALAGLDVVVSDNPDYAEGMASSLKKGLEAIDPGADGLLVMLADMPAIGTNDLRRLMERFRRAKGEAVVRASHDGKRGNPVILPQATFAAIRKLEGDVGARQVVETCGLPIIDVELGPAAHLDLDTPDAVIAAGGILKG